jgi:hypothetical protein
MRGRKLPELLEVALWWLHEREEVQVGRGLGRRWQLMAELVRELAAMERCDWSRKLGVVFAPG